MCKKVALNGESLISLTFFVMSLFLYQVKKKPPYILYQDISLIFSSFLYDIYKMGQDQSKPTDSPVPNPKSSESESSTPPSMESLLAEATAYGNEDEDLSMEAKAQKALECPCIQNLRSGPCGSQFSEAFLCFLKSTAEEKGSDCVIPFVALQRCIQTNPNAFPKDVLENDEVPKEETEKPVEDYKIIPPRWSMESSRPKHKL